MFFFSKRKNKKRLHTMMVEVQNWMEYLELQLHLDQGKDPNRYLVYLADGLMERVLNARMFISGNQSLESAILGTNIESKLEDAYKLCERVQHLLPEPSRALEYTPSNN
jgi:hypothetical protein